MRVDTLTSIRVFRQVVESGSFVAAAERMDLSTAMVSKHVAYVEKRLGVRLLNRNSRKLSLTEPGSVYFERCKTILEDLEATELELGSLGTVPRGTVRVTCPSWFARQRLADMLAEFRRRYPEIVVDVSFEDRVVDLVEEGYDLALRVTRRLASAGTDRSADTVVSFFIAASREYLKRNGAPKSPEELAHHDFVAVGNIDAISLTGLRKDRSSASGRPALPLDHRCGTRRRRRHRSCADAGYLLRGTAVQGSLDARAHGLSRAGADAVRRLRQPEVFTVQDPRLHRFLGAADHQACSAQTGRRPLIRAC